MRIRCPHCGERGHAEFSYLGDAAPVRPRAGVAGALEAGRDADQEAREFHDYVYLRPNLPGAMREWWQHTGGCRAWIAVERNVSTHAIGAVETARGMRSGAR